MPVLARSARDASQGNVTTMVGAGASHSIHHFRAQRLGIHDRQLHDRQLSESNQRYDFSDKKFPIVSVFRMAELAVLCTFETMEHAPLGDLRRHCIAGKALGWPHLEIRDMDEVPLVHVDYRFMTRKGDSDVHSLLSCADSKSGSEKRLEQRTRCLRGGKVVQFLIFLGRAALSKVVANASEHDAQDECTPKCSSPSLGVGESMNRVVEGQVRTVRSALEVVLHVPVAIDFAVKKWTVGHAAWVLVRLLVYLNGLFQCARESRSALAATWPSSARWLC